jgi:hypothetical protein
MMVDHGVLKPDHIDHQAAQHMQSTMGHGMHKEPNSLLLEPGKTGEIALTLPSGRRARVRLQRARPQRGREGSTAVPLPPPHEPFLRGR